MLREDHIRTPSIHAKPYQLWVLYCNETKKISFSLPLPVAPSLTTIEQVHRATRHLVAKIENFGRSENLPDELLSDLSDDELDGLLYLIAKGHGNYACDFFIDMEKLEIPPLYLADRHEGEIFRLAGIGAQSVYLESIESPDSVIVDYLLLPELYDIEPFGQHHPFKKATHGLFSS